MLVLAAFPLEVRLLEPLVLHVGQLADDERVAVDDAKLVIDEIAIVSYSSLNVFSRHSGLISAVSVIEKPSGSLSR